MIDHARVELRHRITEALLDAMDDDFLEGEVPLSEARPKDVAAWASGVLAARPDVVPDPAEIERAERKASDLFDEASRLKRAAVDARDELDDAHRQLNTLRLDLARKSAEFDALTLRAENVGISDQEIERIGDQAWTAVEDAADRVAAVRAALNDIAALHVQVALLDARGSCYQGCAEDREHWPCDTAKALARHGVTTDQAEKPAEKPDARAKALTDAWNAIRKGVLPADGVWTDDFASALCRALNVVRGLLVDSDAAPATDQAEQVQP